MSQDEMSDTERYGIAILDIPMGWSDKVLESQRAANFAIIALIILAALPLLGIGFLTTRPFAPMDTPSAPLQAAVESSQ